MAWIENFTNVLIPVFLYVLHLSEHEYFMCLTVSMRKFLHAFQFNNLIFSYSLFWQFVVICHTWIAKTCWNFLPFLIVYFNFFFLFEFQLFDFFIAALFYVVNIIKEWPRRTYIIFMATLEDYFHMCCCRQGTRGSNWESSLSPPISYHFQKRIHKKHFLTPPMYYKEKVILPFFYSLFLVFAIRKIYPFK